MTPLFLRTPAHKASAAPESTRARVAERAVFPRPGQVSDAAFAAALRDILRTEDFRVLADDVILFGERVSFHRAEGRVYVSARDTWGSVLVGANRPATEDWEAAVDDWELTRAREALGRALEAQDWVAVCGALRALSDVLARRGPAEVALARRQAERAYVAHVAGGVGEAGDLIAAAAREGATLVDVLTAAAVAADRM